LRRMLAGLPPTDNPMECMERCGHCGAEGRDCTCCGA